MRRDRRLQPFALQRVVGAFLDVGEPHRWSE
jgi:hypothetical protein